MTLIRRAASALPAVLSLLLSAQAPLPTPPMPPAHPPGNDLAPVPDRLNQTSNDEPDHPNLTLRFYRAERPDTSLGYIPGSHYPNSDDRRQYMLPGFLVRVPFNKP